jgi:NAD+ synthase (glutamine-hydrolysing)
MPPTIVVASCTLNLHAMSFSHNLAVILSSLHLAFVANASYRLGPELEITGYSCEDHFLESDTASHAWEVLAAPLKSGYTSRMLCDFGMPVEMGGVRYNCRVLCIDNWIVGIRPKMALADDGNYREGRWFTRWEGGVVDFHLPDAFLALFPVNTKPTKVPFGFLAVRSLDGVTIGCETCEEMWTPKSTAASQALQGVDVIGNASGSHHELRKVHQRQALINASTLNNSGCYVYSNLRGCDGTRLYFDGSSSITLNGELLAMADQFDLSQVELITATIDVDAIRSRRASRPSFGAQAAAAASPSAAPSATAARDKLAIVDLEVPLGMDKSSPRHARVPTKPIKPRHYTPEEECALGPGSWMYDYMRRSGATGFMLPLSGGADSAAVAAIVGSLTVRMYEGYVANTDETLVKEVNRLCGADSPPKSAKDIAKNILHTVYMGTENSSGATRARAKQLADEIGCYHTDLNIDNVTSAIINVFQIATGRRPMFACNGGTMGEDLALQNIQARSRMIIAYLMGQLLPWVRGKKGFLLVLGSANVDEGLRGYMTKYDCSSADINPIGGISKKDLKSLLTYASTKYMWPSLQTIVAAPPTAELRPISDAGEGEHTQTDEEDMGMTYDELTAFGVLRKQERCGPVSMYNKLLGLWFHLEPAVIAEKVQRFFYFYSMNRHKMCTITPSYHAEGYSPDDNRYDQRPFLYDTSWSWQKDRMNELVAEEEEIGERGRGMT